jgi:ornithine--oxo-acid transaminase
MTIQDVRKNKVTASPELIDTEDRLGANNYQPLGVVLCRGEGVWVWDIAGKRYLDCLAGYSAVSQGHCHPKIREAMVAQARRLTLTSRAFRNDQLALFYEDLARLTGAHKILPMNSGAEAVETAIKIVRKWGYELRGVPEAKAEIIVGANNFHGRTIAIVGFSTDPQRRKGFGPFATGFRIVPFGDFDAFVAAIRLNTVAFLVEPIQGEAGVIIPPAGYFSKVRSLCSEKQIALVLDEVQTGLGRTGKLLAEEHEGIEADVTLLGKALSGGFYPISAVLSNNELMSPLKPGDHGSTFGGNPLACAVARAALRVLIEEGMIDNAAEQGAYLKAGLESVRTEAVKAVRGRGLMIAVELYPEVGDARLYCEALARRGILTTTTHDHIIRISPPLVIKREEVDWAIDRIGIVLAGQHLEKGG